MAIVCSVEKAIPHPLQIPVDGIFQPHIRPLTETTISRNCVLSHIMAIVTHFWYLKCLTIYNNHHKTQVGDIVGCV